MCCHRLNARIRTSVSFGLLCKNPNDRNAKTVREKGLARSIGLQLNSKLQAWSKALSNSRGSDELADWRRGIGALLSDQAALAAALSDRTLLPAVPPGMPIG